MDRSKGSFKYTIDSRKSVEMYSNIPTDKPLFPVIFLKYKEDKVIISDNNWKPIMIKKFIKEKENKIEEEEEEKKVQVNIKKEEEIKKQKYDKDEKEPNVYPPRGNRGFLRPRRGIPIRRFPGRRGPGFRGFRARRGKY